MTQPVIRDLSDATAEIRFTHSAMWGPLEATVAWEGSLEEGFEAADWIGGPLEIYSPDGEWLWEGLVWSVEFGTGTRRRRRSLDGYANVVRVHYKTIDASTDPPTEIGPATPYEVRYPAHEDIYGTIEHQVSAGGLHTGEAAVLATQENNRRSTLLYIPTSGSSGGNPTIEITAMGWWRTLGFQVYRDLLVYRNVDVSTMIKAALYHKAPFLATYQVATTDPLWGSVETSGTTFTWNSDRWETPHEIIKRLVSLTPGWVFGIGEGRVPYFREGKRLSSVVDYVEQLDGTLTTPAGNPMPPELVRPDTILRQADFVPTSTNLTTALEGIENVYLSETTWDSVSGLRYKPAVVGVLGEISA